MRRIIIFVIVGLIMFGVGFGGGLMLGRTMAGGAGSESGPRVPAPGPVVHIGEFTSNLAGTGRHIISFTVSLEVINNPRAIELVNADGWLLRIRNAVLMIIKGKRYEDLTSAEGMHQFGEDIKTVINSELPLVRGDVPVVRVLFETFVLQ